MGDSKFRQQGKMLVSDVSFFFVFHRESNPMMSFSQAIINCLVAEAVFSLVEAGVL